MSYTKPDGDVVSYSWDGNGNMVGRTEGGQTTQFAYDYDNRLIKITYPDGSVVQFGYDGLGRRVWRQDSVSLRHFFYDGDKIIAEREGSSWVVRYLLGLKPCGFVANGKCASIMQTGLEALDGLQTEARISLSVMFMKASEKLSVKMVGEEDHINFVACGVTETTMTQV